MRVRGSARSCGRACDRARVMARHGLPGVPGCARAGAGIMGSRAHGQASTRAGASIMGIRYGLRLWMGCAWHAGTAPFWG